MKILSDREYNNLVTKNNSSEVEELKRNHRLEIEDIRRDFENRITDAQLIVERAEDKAELVLEQKTSELNSQIQTLKLEKGNLAKEVEILTKAFENMGFDVKDMKEILNKLVDGIVSKNQIQLVK